MLKIGVLISGGGSNLQCLIDETESGKIKGEIVKVIANKEDAYGLERAQMAGIDNKYLNPKDFKDLEEYNNQLVKIFKEAGVDLIVLAGYLRILSGDILKEYKNKIVNIHPSLIPSFCGDGYYGSRVHQAVLDYGCKITGATVHFVDEGTDTGPIIIQRVAEVKQDDNLDSLQKRVLEVEHEILVEAVKLICEDRVSVSGRKVKLK